MDKFLHSVAMVKCEHRGGVSECRNASEEEPFGVIVLVTAIEGVGK